MKELAKFFCPNPKCAHFEQRAQRNSRIHDRYGPDKDRLLLYCNSCGERFSETWNTLLYQAKLFAGNTNTASHPIKTHIPFFFVNNRASTLCGLEWCSHFPCLSRRVGTKYHCKPMGNKKPLWLPS